MILERTIQQRFPASAAVLVRVAAGAATVVGAFAIPMTWTNRRDIHNALSAFAAIVALSAAVVLVVGGARPVRAPFGARRALVVIALADAAALGSFVSTFGHDELVRDDWAGVAVGLLLVAIAPFRPPREVAVLGVFSAILLGFMTVLGAPFFVRPVPTILFVAIAIGPVALCTAGAVVFSATLLDGIERWVSRMGAVISNADSNDDEWIRRSVQQDRVTILNRDVVPLLTRVLERGEVARDDALAAQRIAAELRGAVVAQVDRGWLDFAVARIADAAGLDSLPSNAVSDPHRVADALSIDQRIQLRAALEAVFAHPAFDPAEFRVSTAESGGTVQCVISATIDAGPGSVAADLAPFFTSLRVHLPDPVVTFERPRLTVRFRHERE